MLTTQQIRAALMLFLTWEGLLHLSIWLGYLKENLPLVTLTGILMWQQVPIIFVFS